jgi:hypothetical protein
MESCVLISIMMWWAWDTKLGWFPLTIPLYTSKRFISLSLILSLSLSLSLSLCVCVCVFTVAHGGQRYQIPRSWSYRLLWAAWPRCWEPNSDPLQVQSVWAPNHWAISPTLPWTLFIVWSSPVRPLLPQSYKWECPALRQQTHLAFDSSF